MKLRDFNFPGGIDDSTGPYAVPVFTGRVRDLPGVLGVPASSLTIRHFGEEVLGGSNDMLGDPDNLDNLQDEVKKCVGELGVEGAVFADCGDIVEDYRGGRRK